MRRRMSFAAATVVVAVVAAGTGLAGQTKDQQSCVNDMNKYGERVVKSQDGASHDCVENAGRGILFRLGIPPQAQTAQACLTNDVAGKVSRAMTQLQERDTSGCLSAPGPVFPSYSPSAAKFPGLYV